MRRFLVLFLIFLFPFQLFAGSVNWQLPTPANVSERVVASEAGSSVIPAWEASKELPASADVGDFLVEGLCSAQAGYPMSARPLHTAKTPPLVFLPPGTPPPIG